MSLAYDALGRLAQTASSASTTNFLYDGDTMIGEYDGAGTLTRRTIHGPGTDEPIVVYEGNATGTGATRKWLHADPRGSIIAQTDSSGNATAINSYGPYGESGLNMSGRFGYTGQMRLPELGLLHYKARAYSPKYGRFLQPDPIGTEGGLNIYEYAGSDPINASDPSGLVPCSGSIDLNTGAATCFTSPGSPNSCFDANEKGEFLQSCDLGFSRVGGGGDSSGGSDSGGGAGPFNPRKPGPTTPAPPAQPQKKINCNSDARQLAQFGSNTALAFGSATVIFATLGAEPLAAFTGAVTLGADVVTLGAGLYVWYSEGDSSVVKSSAIGAGLGAAGGFLTKAFGGSITRELGGVLVNRRPSGAAVEAGKYVSGNAGQALVKGTCF
jgi:RHS repeat-associated protein